ncbi:hypothetical protein SLS63_013794 [Diaporthe eres]|uniref:Major facilitator superfamily (MFS) profile domain-containing protein n=1 Tax=Diaporthe eres TaxID=83184 RepID=A0ABR1NMJ9_DIAER
MPISSSKSFERLADEQSQTGNPEQPDILSRIKMSKVGARRPQAEMEVARPEAPRFERVTWYREPHLRKLYAMSLVLMIASATTGYDGMLVNTSQQIRRWEQYFGLDIDDNNKLGVLINMFNIGSIVSFFITPYVADNYGRKNAIIAGCIFMIGGGCLTAFCDGYAPYIDNDWSWRSITLIQIVPSVIQITFIWWLPESPRYLVNKDRNEEALIVLSKCHSGGDIHDAVVQFEFQEIKQTIQMDRDADKATSYLDFMRTKGNRWRLAIIISLGIISQYSGNALFSNYMNTIYEGAGITMQSQKLAMSTGKTILDLVVTIAAALNVDRFGRRPLFLISTSGMVVAFAAWTATGAIYENSNLTNIQSGYAQLVFIWLFGIFYDIGFSGLLVAYALEILPFHLRAKGMMIMNITVQAVLAVGNQTNKIAWDSFPRHWVFMLFYTCWDVVELIFVWLFYVETKGPTLEEIARIFDGDDAVAHIDLNEIAKELHGDHYEEAHFEAYRHKKGPSARERYYS